jgi:hypothetical protein
MNLQKKKEKFKIKKARMFCISKKKKDKDLRKKGRFKSTVN